MKSRILLLILMRNEQEGDSGSQDEELQELVQQSEPELNASDTYDNNENWRDELHDEVLSGSHAKKKNRLLVK